MTAIRKRSWVSPTGEQKTAWLVDYRDVGGNRRSKQFLRKKDAQAWSVSALSEVQRGTHTADSQSITIELAAGQWLDLKRANDLEPSTIASYEQHVRLHIVPLCGKQKLNQVTRPMAELLRDQLATKLSQAMASRVLKSLSSIFSEAERRGYVAQNVFRDVKPPRAKRAKSKITIPSKGELRAILVVAKESKDHAAAALVLLLVFTGLRASELRGLTWDNIDLQKGTVAVTKRADFQNIIGLPKSDSSHRTVTLPESAILALKQWKLACPLTLPGLVFPSPRGKVMSNPYMTKELLHTIQCQAGVRKLSASGKPIGRYTLHDFRHLAASLWIALNQNPKKIQKWMGHSSIQVTFDTYGHLFESSTEDAAVAADLDRKLTQVDEDAAWMLQMSWDPQFLVA